jgi:hypothetical protein
MLGRCTRKVSLGLLLFAVTAIIGLSHASPASAQTTQSYLPDGASLQPGGLWKPPTSGEYFEKDQWGRITGAYGCVSFSQLPPSANTICGYIDIWPQPAPAGVNPPAGQQWMCIPGINILPYSVPFNKGSCGFFSSSSPPANAFVPTTEQTAAAKEFLKPYRSDGDKDNISEVRDNCPA